MIHSAFLIDLKSCALQKRSGLPRGLIEVEEVEASSVLEESIEILCNVGRGHELFVYQELTVWGDQIATFTVRENVKKRMYRLVHETREFPLVAPPARIVDTFWWSRRALRSLEVPPGLTKADRELLQQIEARWLALATEEVC